MPFNSLDPTIWKSTAKPGSSISAGIMASGVLTTLLSSQQDDSDYDDEDEVTSAAITTPLPPSPPPSPPQPSPPTTKTLASRRQILPLPQHLTSLLSASNIKSISRAKKTAEAERNYRHDQEARTPTPSTADFKTMLETYVEDPGEVERLVEMAGRIKEGRVREARGGGIWEGKGRGLGGWTEDVRILGEIKWARGGGRGDRGRVGALLAELRVKEKLLPGMVLLSRSGKLRRSEAREAAKYARSALRVAQGQDVDKALQARCAYYIGLAEYLLAENGARGLPLSSATAEIMGPPATTSTQESGKIVVGFFKQARAAQGVYAEGDWAEEWIRQLNYPLGTSDASKRVGEKSRKPDSWMSTWFRGLWTPSRNRSSPSDSSQEEKEDSSSPNSSSDSTFGAGERIPSFSTESSSEGSRSASLDDETAPSSPMSPYNPPTPSSISSSFHSDAGEYPSTNPTEEPTLPLPVTSPNHSPSKPSTFASLTKGNDLTTLLDSVSPKQSLHERRHSRRPSFFLRERRPSELELAEEGNSPFRATFESVPEAGDVSKGEAAKNDGDLV